ncbi:MAG: AAA family ATPase [Rhodospirillaceae bacterium]|nr:AAA family ATPase [Rhodospirillaceae bacterium]|tara:strand:+ start:1214 stop:2224 length:1011 start_codon:yes stop_codon:yes gene_type:complete
MENDIASTKTTDEQIIEKVEAVRKSMSNIRSRLSSIVFGQSEAIDLTLITILSGGHALLVGVPGLAKTTIVQAVGCLTGSTNRRIQCTPDLMPADILGSEVLDTDNKGHRYFRFIKGPIFSQILMVDEINRASPRSQSALLQAMQEKQVTIAGETLDLPSPFHVLATQNPLEQEGTYPLPEAQLDRFLMQIDLDYPDRTAERRMLINESSPQKTTFSNEMHQIDLASAQSLVGNIPVSKSVLDVILSVVTASRPDSSEIDQVKKYVAWGAGPRASQALLLSCRARAILDGRLSPSIEDVLALAKPVLKHRMALSFTAQTDNFVANDIIDIICKKYR